MVFTYAHMSDVAVKKGDPVPVGGQLGAVGNTGKCDPPSFSHLHFDAAIFDGNAPMSGDGTPSQMNTPRVDPYPFVSQDFVPDYVKEAGPDGGFLTDANGNWVIQEQYATATIT